MNWTAHRSRAGRSVRMEGGGLWTWRSAVRAASSARRLSASLRADGHRVLRLTRGGVTGDDTIGWDPDAGRIDAPALEGVDAVVHLAGEGIGEQRWTDEQKRRIRESRVRGTAVLAAAVASRERKPRVFVSGSAIGYYGNRGDEVLTEQSAPGDDFLAEVCVAWEAETQPAADAGVRTVLTRTGIVLDAHGGALGQDAAAVQARARRPAGLGQAVDELDRARRRGRRDPPRDRRRVGARPGQPRRAEPGHQRRVRRARSARCCTGRRSCRRRCCPLKLRFGAELVESLLLASQRVAPAQLVATGYEFTCSSLDAALARRSDARHGHEGD